MKSKLFFRRVSPRIWARTALIAINKVFQKIAKAYFCFWSAQLLFMHFVAFLFAVSVIMLLNPAVSLEIIKVVLSFVFVHLFVVAAVRSICITKPRYNGSQYFCQIILVDGNAKLLKGPIWAKGTQYEILNFQHSQKTAVFKATIDYRHGPIKISIPLSLTMHLEKKFDNLELFNVLYENQVTRCADSSLLSLDKYIVYWLNSVNKESLKLMPPLIDSFIAQEIPTSRFFYKTAELVTFPQQPFSNVSKVTFCLEAPSFYYCHDPARMN
jgi:hypothetical protein